MRFKLDENLPLEALDPLQNSGHDARHVPLRRTLAEQPTRELLRSATRKIELSLPWTPDSATSPAIPLGQHLGLSSFGQIDRTKQA